MGLTVTINGQKDQKQGKCEVCFFHNFITFESVVVKFYPFYAVAEYGSEEYGT